MNAPLALRVRGGRLARLRAATAGRVLLLLARAAGAGGAARAAGVCSEEEDVMSSTGRAREA